MQQAQNFLKEAESDAVIPSGNFSPGKGNLKIATSRKPFKVPFLKKKYVPVISFATIMTSMVFAVFALSTFSFPIAFVTMVRNTFDTISDSNSMRSRKIIKKMFKNSKAGEDNEVYEINKRAAKDRFFNDAEDLDRKQRKKLKKLGYDVEGEGGSRKLRNSKNEEISISKFNDLYDNDIEFRAAMDSGITTVDSIDWERHKFPIKEGFFKRKFHFTKRQLRKLANQGIEYDRKNKQMIFKDHHGKLHKIGVDDFDAAFKVNSDFRNKFLAASKTWRGAIAGWTNSKIKSVIKRLGGGLRNHFADFDASEEKQSRLAKLANKIKRNRSHIGVNSAKVEYEKDEDGKIKMENGEKVIKEKNIVEVDSTNHQAKVSTAIDKVASSTGAITTLVNANCQLLAILSTVQSLISAEQKIQAIGLAADFLEAIDKTKAGDGSKSPLPDMMDMMMKPDKNGRTAIDSYGVRFLFDNNTGMSDIDKESVASAGNEGLMSSSIITKTLRWLNPDSGNLKDRLETCAKIRLSSSGAMALFGVLGGGKILKEITVGALTGGVAQSLIGNKIIEELTEYAVQKIKKDVVDITKGYFGDDAGNSLVAASHDYQGTNAQSNGLTLGSEQKLAQYQTEIASVIKAEREQYDRETLSPFDTSSPNTFLGSIMFNLTPTLNRASSGSFATIAAVNQLALNSLGTITPRANAIKKNISPKMKGECPMLKSIGGVGDPYCIPYRMTDPTTIDMEPEEVFEKVNEINVQRDKFDTPIEGDSGQCKKINSNTKEEYYEYTYSSNFIRDKEKVYPGTCEYVIKENDDGNPIINSYSELGGYIRYCGQRNSQFGMADGNIAGWAKYINFQKGTISEKFKGFNESIASGVASVIPIVGDVLDVIDAVNDSSVIPWTTGSICVASDSNPDWNSKFKYYQRYVEDQNLFESMGIIKKASSTDLIEAELASEEMSYDEQVARMAGMTLAQFNQTIDQINHYAFLLEYDTANRLPMPRRIVDIFAKIKHTNVHKNPIENIALHQNPIFCRERKNVAVLG